MPTATLIGSLIVAAGLFFGLRERAPAPVQAVAAAPTRTHAPTPATIPVTPRDEVARQAREALAYHREVLRERCYLPAVAGEASPRPARSLFNVTFDASGAQVVRGIVEVREASISEVTRCVGRELPPLHVPPPGVTTMVEVPLDFP